MIVYLVTIVPTKSSKSSYILGVFKTEESARLAANAEINRPDPCWWTNFTIHKLEVKD